MKSLLGIFALLSLWTLIILLTGCTHSFHLPPATGPYTGTVCSGDCMLAPIIQASPAPQKDCLDCECDKTPNSRDCVQYRKDCADPGLLGGRWVDGHCDITAPQKAADPYDGSADMGPTEACAKLGGANCKAADAAPEAPVGNLFCPFKANERGEQIPCRLNSKNQVEYIDGTTPEATTQKPCWIEGSAVGTHTTNGLMMDEHGKEIPCQGSDDEELGWNLRIHDDGLYSANPFPDFRSLRYMNVACRGEIETTPQAKFIDPIRTITVWSKCVNGQWRFMYWVSRTKPEAK